MNIASPLEILPKRSVLLSIIGLFFFVLLIVYGTSLSYGFVRWDDGILIYENAAVRGISLQNLKAIFTTYDPELYIPLTLLSYQIDYMIGGINPSIYHFHNLFLHCINSLLVTWLLLSLTQKRWIALFLGLIFAIHPLNTETVIWASARKDLLATVFFLASIISYLIFRPSQKKAFYYGSIAAFALGLMAKVTIIGLPLILVLIDWKETRIWSRNILIEKIPFFVLSGVFAVIAVIGKTNVLSDSSPLEKILIPAKSFIFYIQKFLVPAKLSVLYPIASDIELTNPVFLIPFVMLIAITVLAVYSLRKTKVIFFGLGWFALCTGPTVLNFAKGDFIYYASDRYAYAGMIGLLFIVGSYLPLLSNRALKQDWLVGSGVIVVLTLSGLTMHQTTKWENTFTLFQNAIHHYPDAAAAGYNNVGNHISLQYREEGKSEEAIELYKKALDISHEHSRNIGDTNPGVSKILSNLASAYRQKGDFALALETYKESLMMNPVNIHALLGLGTYYMQQGSINLAESYFLSAIDLHPLYITSYVNLGSLYVQTGRYQEAVDILEIGVGHNPFYPQALYNLGIALKKVGRHTESLSRLEEAVALESRFTAARINLGIAYAERKRIDEAIEQFTSILQYDPSNARARSAIQQLTGR